MATIVFVHAHPDDEASQTAGSMARAAAEGHRVVLVVCTNGDHGEVPDDLAPGETLVDRRRRETEASAAALGVAEVRWLGYRDSGMHGWEQNADPASFWQADVDEAAARLAAILREVAADVVVVYDWHGNYGHPDHIQVHRVGHRAADLAGTPRRYESTMNRDFMVRMFETMGPPPDGMEGEDVFDPRAPMDDGNPFGSTEEELTLAVDVTPYLEQKRRALAAHASQVTDIGMFLSMPPEVFTALFGTEWYIEPGNDAPLHEGWLLDGLAA
jgi:LmbE family N-acetylglucosaminyl deacetylase